MTEFFSITARRRREPILVLALTVLYYLCLSVAVPAIAGVVMVFLALYVVLVPGISLSRLFPAPHRDPVEVFTSSLLYGLAFLLACGVVWAFTGVSRDAFAYWLSPVVLLLYTISYFNGRASDDPQPAPHGEALTRFETVVLGVLVVFIVGVALAVLLAGPPVGFTKDTLDHVGYVNEVAATGEAFPTTAFYQEPGADGADIRKGVLHAIYGFAASYLGIGALATLRWFNGLLTALLLLTIYTSARRMFGDRYVAALSVALFVIGFDGGLDTPLLRTTFYPNRFGLAFLLMFTAAALDYQRRPTRRSLLGSAAYAFAAVAVHAQNLALVGLVALIIVVWKTCFRERSAAEHLRRSLTVAMVALAAMTPYLAFRFVGGYQSNPLHEQVQGALYILDGLFVVNPLQVWGWLGLVGMASVVAMVPLWRGRRVNAGVGFGIASMLTVLLVQFNPIVMPALHELITYLVFRLGQVTPYYMLSAFALVHYLRQPAMGRTRPLWWHAVFILVAAAILFDGSALLRRNAFSPSYLRAERSKSHYQWEEGLRELAAHVPPGSVMASDPVTSYTIAAFTPHYVLCTLDQHAPPNDLRVEERMAAARDIVSPYTSNGDRTAIMNAHGVTHVVINGRLPDNLVLDYWSTDARMAEATRVTLDEHPSVFRRLDLMDGFTVFEWNGALLPRSAAQLPMVVDAPLVPAAMSVVTVGDASVAGVRFEPAIIAGGRDLNVTLYWQRDRVLEPGNYVATLRFDHQDPQRFFGGRPFPKPMRKLKEHLLGQRYRFRYDFKPFAGLFGPDRWPKTKMVREMRRIRIPRDLVPGTYIVRATMATRSHVPNYRLRDFLYDDDLYHGAEIGRIVIE